jgi:hypothetical protein
MIIEPTEVTEYGETFNRLTHSSPFFAVGYDDSLIIMLITDYNEEEPNNGALPAGSKVNGLLNGFGCEDFQELEQEISNRNLTYP